MSISLNGSTNKGPVEVGLNTLAAYTYQKPNDYGFIGSYAMGFTLVINSVTFTPANSAVVAAMWNVPSMLAIMKKVVVSVGSSNASPNTAGTVNFQLLNARGFTVQYTTAVSASIKPGVGCKLKTSMQPSQFSSPAGFASIVTSDGTAGLSGATNVIDPTPVGNVWASQITTSGSSVFPAVVLYDAKIADYPLVLDNEGGFVIQATFPAGGAAQTCTNSFTFYWDEYVLNSFI